eukprot:g2100.t1
MASLASGGNGAAVNGEDDRVENTAFERGTVPTTTEKNKDKDESASQTAASSLAIEVEAVDVASATVVADEFVIYELKVTLRETTGDHVQVTETVAKRYSSMWRFHFELQAKFGSAANKAFRLPRFPPKKYFGNFFPQFIESRRCALQVYFDALIVWAENSISARNALVRFLRYSEKSMLDQTFYEHVLKAQRAGGSPTQKKNPE